jgi:hypothetical protein
VTTEFDVPKLGPDHPQDQPPRESDGYQILTLAAKGLLELTKAFPSWFGDHEDEEDEEVPEPAADASGDSGDSGDSSVG